MKKLLRSAALCLSALLTLTTAPLSAVQAASSEGKEIYVTGFEDGDVSKFSKRGDDDTSVIKASAAEPHSGDQCMEVTERDQGWNGPSIALKDLCEPGVLYVASAWVKAKWYNSCKLSMQYTDSEGVQHYNNLSKATSQGEWVKLPPIRFCLFDSMKDVSLYIECDDKADLWVDDFSLTEAPFYEIEKDIPGLKDVFNDCFKLGGAVTAQEIAAKSTQALVLKHYNSLTLGNELKPENMLREKASQALYEETGDNTRAVVKLNDAARYILDFCRKYRIPVRGHVLVWYSQTPYWFFTEDFTKEGAIVDKTTMLKRMENYIKDVFAVLDEEYPDVDFYAWDVVNEAFLDGGSPREPGKYEDYNGSSAWVKIFGDNSFIPPAFEYARKYARKGTKLYYNDFNEYMKVDAMLRSCTRKAGWTVWGSSRTSMSRTTISPIRSRPCSSMPPHWINSAHPVWTSRSPSWTRPMHIPSAAAIRCRQSTIRASWMPSSRTRTRSPLSSSGVRQTTRAGEPTGHRCSLTASISRSPALIRSSRAESTRPARLRRRPPRPRPLPRPLTAPSLE